MNVVFKIVENTTQQLFVNIIHNMEEGSSSTSENNNNINNTVGKENEEQKITTEEKEVKNETHVEDPMAWMNVCGNEESYFRLENWYPDIKEYTFATKWVDMTMKEALALKKYAELLRQLLIYRDLKAKKRNVGQWENTDYPEVIEELNKNFDPEEYKQLQSLKDKFDEIIKEFVASSGAAFLKLSTRSPKDSAFYTRTMKDMIEADIKNSKYEGNTKEAEIEDITSFVRASCRCLAVSSGEEALMLFTRSRRVLADISSAELMSNNKDEKVFTLSVVAREWNPHVLPEWEFRVFIQNGRLTAATQYNSIVYVPEMVEKKEEIKKAIIEYWNKVKESIKANTYTMDLALEPTLTNICIIELNSPPPSAGVALFNWDNAADRQQIENGETFELRVSESLPKGVMDMIHQPIRYYIDTLRNRPIPNIAYKTTSCSVCHRFPISKTFYNCNECGDFDVCLLCFHEKKKNVHEHKLEKIGDDEVDPDYVVEEKKNTCIIA